MKIFVDADSFPREARLTVEKFSLRTGTPLVYAANHDIPFFEQSPLFTMKLCSQTEGAADDFIVANATEEDIALTRDIPLAARLVEKKITTLNDRGTVFNRQNVSEMLEERELKMQMQNLGIGPKTLSSTYGKKEKSAFAITLDKILTAKIRELKK